MRRGPELDAVEPLGGRRPRLIGMLAVMPAALMLYAIVAGAGLHRWSSAGGAVIVAGLLWRRHPRARFSAYLLFSVMAVRGALVGDWATLTLALVAVVVMQTPAAARAWPRLRPGATRSDSDRMARP
ncbi:MAG: hypothetical protein WED01_12360 [Candidatus Rokuibacteriota bacterium]